VDTLKQAATIPEEQEEDDDDADFSESDPETTQPANTQSRTDSQITALHSTAQITYGQQRSYVMEQNEDAILEMMMEDITQSTAPAASQSQREIDEELEDDSHQGQPRSVHELRAAGAKKRLLHELESLVAGVEGEGFNSASSSRSALLELASKLLEPPAVACLLDHGLHRQLLPCFARSNDTVFNFLAAICVSFLVQGTDNLSVLRKIHRSGFLPVLLELLMVDEDISKVVRERRQNMSRIAQSSVLEFKDPVIASRLWTEDKPKILSPQIVALRAIELLIRRMRELKHEDVLLDGESVVSLLTILQHQLTALEIDRLTSELVLSVLESSSMCSSQGGRTPWTTKSFKLLVKALPHIMSAGRDSDRLRHLALRLSLNLTNKNERASEIFAAPAFIQSIMNLMIRDFAELLVESTEAEDSVLDELVLSLGAMINLTELSDKARLCLLEGDGKALGQAVKIFQDGQARTVEVYHSYLTVGFATALLTHSQADSVEASRTNVPYGYLAVLLANLCQNEEVKRAILTTLPIPNFNGLIAVAEEFIRIHQQTDRELSEGGEGAEVTNRLMTMVRRLKTLIVET
jgi:hypothetical protein